MFQTIIYEMSLYLAYSLVLRSLSSLQIDTMIISRLFLNSHTESYERYTLMTIIANQYR